MKTIVLCDLQPAEKHKHSAMSAAEDAFAAAWARNPLAGSDFTREHVFHPVRRWRFDFAFPSQRVAVEIEGAGSGPRCPACHQPKFGRHQQLDGARKDAEKYNTAAAMGWRVLRFMAADKAHADEWVTDVRAVLTGAPIEEHVRD